MKSSKLVLSAILGIVFWFTGVMTVRLLGNDVFTDNNPYLILIFALIFPITYVFILISIKVCQLQKSEISDAVVVMTFTAAFFDGFALTWFRQIYHSNLEVAFHGAAWILWGAAAGLLIGYLMTKRQSAAEN